MANVVILKMFRYS